MQTGKENFVLIDKGDIDTFLGIEIAQLNAKIFKVTQPYSCRTISYAFLSIDTKDYRMETNPKTNTCW